MDDEGTESCITVDSLRKIQNTYVYHLNINNEDDTLVIEY